jgi:hypothetical protein
MPEKKKSVSPDTTVTISKRHGVTTDDIIDEDGSLVQEWIHGESDPWSSMRSGGNQA